MTKQENIEELNSLLRLGPLTGLSSQTLEAIKEATIAYEEQELILDKIRDEITDTGAYEQETMGQTAFLNGINYCLGVIDKYKEEKENG